MTSDNDLYHDGLCALVGKSCNQFVSADLAKAEVEQNQHDFHRPHRVQQGSVQVCSSSLRVSGTTEGYKSVVSLAIVNAENQVVTNSSQQEQ